MFGVMTMVFHYFDDTMSVTKVMPSRYLAYSLSRAYLTLSGNDEAVVSQAPGRHIIDGITINVPHGKTLDNSATGSPTCHGASSSQNYSFKNTVDNMLDLVCMDMLYSLA